MKFDDIIYQKEDGIAILTLNNPDVMNAYTRKMVREMATALDDAAEDDEIKGLIITATGRGFCTGVNNKDTEAARTGIRSIVRHELRLFPAMDRLWNYDKPTICAINGIAAGAGTALAMVCDVRVASDQAQFIMVWARRGMVPDNGASYFLVRLVGPAKAYELTFSGEAIDAEEMVRVGLANRVVPHDKLMQEAKDMAAKLTAGAPIAIQLSKQLTRRAMIEPDLYMQMELEGNFQRIANEAKRAARADNKAGEKKE